MFCICVSLSDWSGFVNSVKLSEQAADPRLSNTAGNFNLRACGAACTLVSQVASSGRSGHDKVVTWGWWRLQKKVDVVYYWGLYLLIYWGFDRTGKCGMDRYYASFRELESNFRPARVFHSACAVTSYYEYLKQRTKTLFQILFSLGHCSHSVHTIIYAAIQRDNRAAHSHSKDTSSQTPHTACASFIESPLLL